MLFWQINSFREVIYYNYISVMAFDVQWKIIGEPDAKKTYEDWNNLQPLQKSQKCKEILKYCFKCRQFCCNSLAFHLHNILLVDYILVENGFCLKIGSNLCLKTSTCIPHINIGINFCCSKVIFRNVERSTSSDLIVTDFHSTCFSFFLKRSS